MYSLRLGTVAPNFQADTTKGNIDFHEFIGDNWVILFSHPEDYTPVCTTELGEMARLEPEFAKRGVKLIGLSANTKDSHEGWIKDIDEVTGSLVSFPIIADKERKVAYLYDMCVNTERERENKDKKETDMTSQDRLPGHHQRRLQGHRLHHPLRLRHRPKEDHPHHPLLPRLYRPQHR